DLLKHDEEGQQEFKASMDKLEKSLSTEEEKKLFAEILRKFEEFRKIADTEIQLRRSGKAQEAEHLAFSPQTAQVRTELRAAMEQLNSIADKISAATKEEGNALESTIRTTTLVATLCGFALGIVVAWFIVRSITGAIARMLALIQEIAANNLAVQDIDITSEDE